MADLQASIDFSVELGAFYNIDLFQRGFYQVRVGLKSFSSRPPMKVTCHPPKNPVTGSAASFKPPTVMQGIAVSQTFQVLYKNEDLLLNDAFDFTVQMLLDCNKLEESIEKAGLKLIVELWFAEDLSEVEDNFEVACTRVYDVNFIPTMGLHMHCPVLFDYFHMAAICLTVHASLIALHQPIYNPKNPAASWPLRGGHMSTLDAALFGANVPVHAYVHIKKPALRSANFMFKQICRLLLSSHESLQNQIKRIAKRTENTRRPITEPEYRDCHALLDSLCKELEAVKSEEEFLLYATSKIAHLCAYNVVLWQTFTEICTYNVRVIKVLAKEHHQNRVKRFSESFFCQEWAKKDVLLCYEPSVNGHNDLASVVRGSQYFQHPPVLPLLCSEIDGDQTNTPIIFEDVYKDESQAPVVLSSADLKDKTSSAWDATSLDGESLSSQTSPAMKIRSKDNKNNQMIKNTMPAIITRPKSGYSMTEEDVAKKEDKDKLSPNPELVGFKRISSEFAAVEPYELGSLSPSNERTTGLVRRKSLLMPSHERRKKRQELKDKFGDKDTDSVDSGDNTTQDNFSLPNNNIEDVEAACRLSDLSSGSSNSTNSTVSAKDVNLSPQSERSFKLNGVKKTSSPNLLRRSKKKNKDKEARGVSPVSHSAQASPQHTRIVTSRSEPRISSAGQFLVQPVTDRVIDFLTNKEDLKAKLAYQGHLYSDFANVASEMPYFWPSSSTNRDQLHFVICVHGLDGNSQDLRLVRQYLELALPNERFEFLMSAVNEYPRGRPLFGCCGPLSTLFIREDTFVDFQTMSEKLADEILHHMDVYGIEPTKVSFIAHSLGNIIVRSALTIPRLLEQIKPKLYTYLSLSGPHLGTMYSDSGLVNMAMWVMQKWKKSGSLIQLAMKDNPDLKATFIYKLSQEPGMEYFKHVLLVSSMQDKYVPYHSTRVEICRSATKDNSQAGRAYIDMVHNLLTPLLNNPSLTLIRYDAFYTLPTNTNSVIGRAAHIAVLDCELFIEKFFLVSACKYFR